MLPGTTGDSDGTTLDCVKGVMPREMSEISTLPNLVQKSSIPKLLLEALLILSTKALAGVRK